MTEQLLTADNLFLQLQKFPQTEHYWIALSGGVDSLVLLHLISSLKLQLKSYVTAIHVNHGLNKKADEWQQQCAELANSMNIPFKAIQVDARNNGDQSPEAWARALRYQAIQDIIAQNDIVLTAHHSNDQLETLLLQLFRGAGPDGLSSMPQLKEFGESYLARPLLEYNRQQIISYAKDKKLQWINDDSNDDLRFDRNYLRHEILPLLKQRWPALAKTLNRVVSHQSETSQLLSDLAVDDLSQVIHESTDALNTNKLLLLSEARQKNVIRFWISEKGFLMPSNKKMKNIVSDLLMSPQDKNPVVKWQGCELRRYRNALFAMEEMDSHDSEQVVLWNLEKDLESKVGVLQARKGTGNGIKASSIENNEVEIRFRRGGEKIKIHGKNNTRELKKLFQEEGILPWYRNRLPLIYIQNKLAMVPGFYIADGFFAESGEASWELNWRSSAIIFNPVLDQ